MPPKDISLRDYFAAAALQGWLASYGPDAPHPAQEHPTASDDKLNNLVYLSYKIADAMVAASIKNENNNHDHSSTVRAGDS